ncbi:hypothetical protein JOM56_007101 [Amanita muscaria]
MVLQAASCGEEQRRTMAIITRIFTQRIAVCGLQFLVTYRQRPSVEQEPSHSPLPLKFFNSRSNSNAHNIANTPSITNYKSLTLLSRSTDSKQEDLEEWVVTPAPPLYKKRQVRAQVFGFPVTQDDISAWAEAHNIPEEDDFYRRQDAWRAICSRIPRNHRRRTIIHNPMAYSKQSMCIVIASNLNAKDLERAQNPELIKSLYDAVDMGKRPRWFYMSRG